MRPLLVFLFFSFAANAQRVFLSCEWPATGKHEWMINSPAYIDTIPVGGKEYYINGFKQQTEQSDIPYLGIHYQFKQSFFIKAYARYSQWKFNDHTQDVSAKYVWATAALKRFMGGLDAGYIFRKRALKPYLSAGLSLTKIHSDFTSASIPDISAYADYVNSFKPLASYVLCAGLKYRNVYYEFSYQKSFNRYDLQDHLGPYSEMCYLKLGFDILRSHYLTTTRFRYFKKATVGKRTNVRDNSVGDSDFGLSVPFYTLQLKAPVDLSYTDPNTNSIERLTIHDSTISYAYIPVLSLNKKFSFIKHPHLYFPFSYGMSFVSYNLKGAFHQISNGSAVFSAATLGSALTDADKDLKYNYWQLYIGFIGLGYKTVLFERYQFHLQAEIDHNIMYPLKTNDEFPSLHFYIPTLHVRTGIKRLHSGIFFVYERSFFNIDRAEIFKSIKNFQIGYCYEIGN
jgi:hypothetical protein